MDDLREQREGAVLEAAREEREARLSLEAAARSEGIDTRDVYRRHARWRAAARALVAALDRVEGALGARRAT